MAYRKFTLEKVVHDFALTLSKVPLFEQIQPIALSSSYRKILAKGLKMALPSGSEKARNELIVMPILLEVQDITNEAITIHSGVMLNVDKRKGLDGECDFILSYSSITEFVETPIVCLVEAKRQDIDLGLGQCAAQMVAARLLNERHEHPLPAVFGCVTTGDLWRFLKMQGDRLVLDSSEYFIRDVDEILGVFQTIIATVTSLSTTSEAEASK